VQPLLQWKSNEYFTTCACICSLRYPACNAHAPYCHLWPAPFYNIFPHYLINGTIFEKTFLDIKCVFWVSLHLSETFLNLRRNERDMIKKMYFGLHVKYPLFLSVFNETWIFSAVFPKIQKYQISWKSVQWEPSCSKRKDRHDEANIRLSQFSERTWKPLMEWLIQTVT
jgi:hypothetical protein